MRKDVLNCAGMVSGEQCVITVGTTLKLVYFVGNLATLVSVSLIILLVLIIMAITEFSLSDFVAYSGAFYGQGSGPVYLDNVNCFGNETRLTDCASTAASSCPHSQDAGVQCRAECKSSCS